MFKSPRTGQEIMVEPQEMFNFMTSAKHYITSKGVEKLLPSNKLQNN